MTEVAVRVEPDHVLDEAGDLGIFLYLVLLHGHLPGHCICHCKHMAQSSTRQVCMASAVGAQRVRQGQAVKQRMT